MIALDVVGLIVERRSASGRFVGLQQGRPAPPDEDDLGMLSFDHVSLVGRTETLADVGLRLTPTRGDDRHIRIYLAGSYLELRTTEPPTALRASGWFLRACEPSTIAQALATRGVTASDATPYHGADGTWSDISVGGAELGAVVPIITYRVDRPDWPPRSGAVHPNGAVAVAELQLATPDPVALTRLLSRLGATVEQASSPTAVGQLELGPLRLVVAPARKPALSALLLRAGDGRRLRLDLSA